MDRISSLENEIAVIRKNLHEKEKELYELKKEWIKTQTNGQTEQPIIQYVQFINGVAQFGDRLPKWAIERYSRQILLPDIGVVGQERLCAAKVLIVGAGGLGCPAAMYLAGAGVGEIGIVDYDTVDLTNIHRQLLHGEGDRHMSKAESAAASLRGINSHITITPYNVQLDSSNALDIVSKYEIVLDCTDNVPTRYLLNDACVLTKLPLISGSALKMEGQITVYGYRAEKNQNEKDPTYIGPCYRCLFPSPPPAETVGSCSANGVAGPVPGAIGALQALEAIKYIVGHTRHKLLVERMLLFDGDDTTFRTVRLRTRMVGCTSCGESSGVTHLLDYEAFCRAQAKEKTLQEARLKTERRKTEMDRRMTGQSYLGFRAAADGDRKWIQDVPKSGRTIGAPCGSNYCTKGKNCKDFTEEHRKETFDKFWRLDWKIKRAYVRSLVDTVPPKRRRLIHKGEVSRKGDSKSYHLFLHEKRVPVCRVMFLHTLGIKEAMVRCWLVKKDERKNSKTPVKAINVASYIDTLPKVPPKCQFCRTSSDFQYLDLNHIKNVYQLYNHYKQDISMSGDSPVSRKTFSKVFGTKNIKIFKPKKKTDVCDVVSQHNEPETVTYQIVEVDEKDVNEDIGVNFYYNQW